MQDNHEMMGLNTYLTDAEVMRAIRYLDPDLCAKQVGESAGTVEGIGANLLTAFTGALSCIGLYVRGL
jgi:hypothetical protein